MDMTGYEWHGMDAAMDMDMPTCAVVRVHVNAGLGVRPRHVIGRGQGPSAWVGLP